MEITVVLDGYSKYQVYVIVADPWVIVAILANTIARCTAIHSDVANANITFEQVLLHHAYYAGRGYGQGRKIVVWMNFHLS